MIVDFPLPDGPTKATFESFSILYEKSSKTIASRSGYLKVTFLNSITPLTDSGVHIYAPLPFSFDSSLSVLDSIMSKMLAPATLALAMSGINALFWPTPIAAKITENIAMYTSLPSPICPCSKSMPANQNVSP